MGWGVLLALVLLLAGGTTVRPLVRSVDEPRPFAADSPVNEPIPLRAEVDPHSAAMVARATRTGTVAANLYAYGVPIYRAAPADPTYLVRCTREDEWGPCPLSNGPRRIPADARPSAGTDGAMAVVQPDGMVDEYWQARRAGLGWTASFGAVNALSGSGWGGASTGSGASRLAGVVRVAEVRDGVIDHALVVQSDTVCAGIFRPPALKTDGTSRRSDCLPEGSRLQLDPSIDLDSLGDLTPAERAVGRALQVYGAYVIDQSGAPLSMSFETAPDATAGWPGTVYTRAGLAHDYSGMPHLPWSALRVLERWDG